MDLSDIQKLKRKGAYKEALHEIDNYLTTEEFEIYMLDLIKADIYVFTGKLIHALDLVDGIADIALEGKHNENLLAGTVKSAALRGLGLIYECAKTIDKFSEFIKSNLDFDPFILSRFYHESGNVFMAKGDLIKAVDKYNLSIPLREKLGDTKGLASVYNKLALVHKMMGEYQKATDQFNKSLTLDKKLGNEQSIAITMGNLGLVLYKIGQVDQAIDYMDRSLIELMRLGNDTIICYALYNLFICMQKVNKDASIAYVTQISEIYSKKENKDNLNIFLIYNLTQALLLKDSSRGKEKYEAQDILSNLTALDVDLRLKMDVLLNLIDLLLEELEAYNYDEVIKEVSKYLNQISDLAKKNNSNRLLIESYIMEARLQLILKNMEDSFSLFKKAKDIAVKYEITDLIGTIDKEREEFEQELASWDNLISKNISTINEINQNKIKQYIEMARDEMNEFSESMD